MDSTSTTTIVVAGLAPYSFTSELVQLLPQESRESSRCPRCRPRWVWLNRGDPPPALLGPHGGASWGEVHTADAADVGTLDQSHAWGDRLVVVVGAGVSAAATGVSFERLKAAAATAEAAAAPTAATAEAAAAPTAAAAAPMAAAAAAAPYPFDREALLTSMETATTATAPPAEAPLCLQLVRLCAALHAPYVRCCSGGDSGALPPFHAWLARAAAARRVRAVVSFNVDSLELLALRGCGVNSGGSGCDANGDSGAAHPPPTATHPPPAAAVPVIQLHGSLLQLTTMAEVASRPYGRRRSLAQPPPAWGDVSALEAIASGAATAADVLHDCGASGCGGEACTRRRLSLLEAQPNGDSGGGGGAAVAGTRRSGRAAAHNSSAAAAFDRVFGSATAAATADSCDAGSAAVSAVDEGALAAASTRLRSLLPRLAVPQLVYNGDVGAAAAARAARAALRWTCTCRSGGSSVDVASSAGVATGSDGGGGGGGEQGQAAKRHKCE